MALSKPETLVSSNTKAYPIVYAEEIGGHRTVDNLTDLYNLSLYKNSVILGSGTETEATGQLWYVQSEKAFYQLIDFDNIGNINGWAKTNIKTTSSSSPEGDQSTGDSNSLLQIIGIDEDGTLSSSSYSLSKIDAPIKSAYNLALSSYQYTGNLQTDLNNKISTAQSKANSSYAYSDNLGHKLDTIQSTVNNAVQKATSSPITPNNIWIGTYAQYNAISSKSSTTIYCITE